MRVDEEELAKRIALGLKDYVLGEYSEHLLDWTLDKHVARMAKLAVDRVKESHRLVPLHPGQQAMLLTGARSGAQRLKVG